MGKYNCWNPGVEASIPKNYQHLETLYDPKNTVTKNDFIIEASKATGISSQYLVLFNAKRMALHEVLIRVTADIVVKEGECETGFDEEYKTIVTDICDDYINKNWTEINNQYFELASYIQRRVNTKIKESLFSREHKGSEESKLKQWLRRKSNKKKPIKNGDIFCEYKIIENYKKRGLACREEVDRAIYKSLYLVIGAVKNHRGFIGRDEKMLATLVGNHVLANYGGSELGEIISPYIEQAKKDKGYTLVTANNAPVLISLKGPSAAGKSYLRAMLQEQISDFEIKADSNATISPDVWRRLLLDFDSLGEAYKYAGPLTGAEVALIDRKLDQYIREKSEKAQAIPHMLVDRFRFDSFSSENVARILHATYAKYIATMHMYFLVTPPEAIVERGWLRGLAQGRYKSVEDLLAHSVEAYQGMPKLLFKWLAYKNPVFKFYFMDNSVKKGEYPRVIAYGTQNNINIIDVSRFLDIDRFKKINIKANSADELYIDEGSKEASRNLSFFRKCVHKINTVNMIDADSQTVYARFNKGSLKVLDQNLYEIKLREEEYRAIFFKEQSTCLN